MLLVFILPQSKYIYSILERAKREGAKSISTLIATSPILSKFGGESMSELFMFRSIVGALQYMTITCPDIVFAISIS
jgi:hypothetical protein